MGISNCLQVKLCNGKLVLVEACRKGFHNAGKHGILCHNLVDLLRQLSRAFDNVSLADVFFFFSLSVSVCLAGMYSLNS